VRGLDLTRLLLGLTEDLRRVRQGGAVGGLRRGSAQIRELFRLLLGLGEQGAGLLLGGLRDLLRRPGGIGLGGVEQRLRFLVGGGAAVSS
jgi:hypothetical protein